MSTRKVPRVLITNDDGPPTTVDGSSPFVYPFAKAVAEQLGWDVRVVVPAQQQSWVGKGYRVSSVATGKYYKPAGPDGTEGELSDLPTVVEMGESAAWVLVEGTPATCSNLALYSLFPPGSFDLVIAGPNFGRNTSTAFALSSGTIGAAMAASLSGIPSIALSFGIMTGYKPPGDKIIAGAIKASCQVVKQLWEMGWAENTDRVDVYSVNVPLLPSMLAPEGPEVQFTTMARTQYARLFKSIAEAPKSIDDAGGPAAIPEEEDEKKVIPKEVEGNDELQLQDEHHERPLKFKFAPDVSALTNPTSESLQPGTDTHALHSGAIAVTPIRAAFEPARAPDFKWRL